MILALASVPFFGKLGRRLKEKYAEKRALVFAAETAWFLLLFVLSVAYLVNSTYNPFIYFRF